jgi:Mrp family chromosome partitioning ATPase
LLGSDEFARFIAKWRRDFDQVVIDSCPLLPVTDAVLVSAAVDSVMLVIRAGSTTREEFRRARELLLQVHAKLVGVVINAADLRGAEYRSYGKHCQYYAANK